jgi:uncharacterized membrane protein YuzA (DUF378 family)
MFIDMILKTFPRTWQAAVALVVMIVALQQAFMGLQAAVMPDSKLGVWGAIKLVVGLIVGLAAAVAFYYFQSQAEQKPAGSVDQLEMLNKYHEAQKKEEALRHTATPVFSSHHGEIKPPQLSNSTNPPNPMNPDKK